MRESGLDLSSYAFEPRQKLLLLWGHRDQSSSDLTKDCVKEYLGKQMSKRVLPNACQENWFGNKLIDSKDWHTPPIILDPASSTLIKIPSSIFVVL